MIQRFSRNTDSVIYYVTNSEAVDPEVKAFLQNEFKRCRQSKLRPVVMYSGDDDLVGLTSGLLVTNRNKMAENAPDMN